MIKDFKFFKKRYCHIINGVEIPEFIDNVHNMELFYRGWKTAEQRGEIVSYTITDSDMGYYRLGMETYWEQNNPSVQTPTRNIAVIATSLQDFNNWRSETLRGHDEPRYGTPNLYVFGHNRYQAILLPDDVRGHMFDGFLLTPHAFEYRENYGYISEIIRQIQQYCLRTNNNERV